MKPRKPKHNENQNELFAVEQMTLVPFSDWRAPDLDALPDRLAGDIGVDLETCDLGLQNEQGGGWAWSGGGFVAGYSITADNFQGYFPVGHNTDGNMDHGRVKRWLNHVLSNPEQPKIFAHAMYDIGWGQNDGVKIAGPVIDVQWVEAVLNEHRRSYSLNNIAKDRLNKEKNEDLLRDAAKAHRLDPKKDLWKLHPKYVGPYAEPDSQLPREIWKVQQPLIAEENLESILELEHSLLPLYMDMRRRGVRVDTDYVEQLRSRWKGDFTECLAEIKSRTGVNVDVWAAASVARAFETEGIGYMKTKTGAPSITAQALEQSEHWLPRLVLKARRIDKLVGTFLEGQLLGQLHSGRLHGQIHPLKSDDGGTVTGRMSMSDPNLQFIPARTKEGQEIRRCLLPEEGELFGSLDFNQQEPRLLVHYASLVSEMAINQGRAQPWHHSAIEARDKYRSDPNMNYHEFAAEVTQLEYKRAKIINLAIIYGRGVFTTSEELGLTTEETKEIFARHHEAMPFAKHMSEYTQARVRTNGFLRSLLGRRIRFPLWEPADWDRRDGTMLEYEAARLAWPGQRLVRARIHKSLNSLIQPSAADQTKAAMRAAVQAGYGKHIMMQVHDELGVSVPDPKIAHAIADLMVHAVELAIPSKVSVKIGPNWRDAE